MLLQEKSKRTPKTAPLESPSPVSNMCSTSSMAFPMSTPHEAQRRAQRVSSVRIRSQPESIETEETSASSKPRPVPPPPCGERVETCRVSPVRTPCQKKTKPSLPSAWPVLPPIPQRNPPQVSKQAQGLKSTKGQGSGVYTCYLMDCPYHNKPKEGSAVHRVLEPVRTSTRPTLKRDVKLHKSEAGPRSSEIRVPYRPKGGPIADPELVPKRTRAGPLTNRTTGAESTLLCGRQSTVHSRRGAAPGGTNSTNLSHVSFESSTQTYPQFPHTVHIIRYRGMHVQCSDLQPHSARLCNIASQPNLEAQHQQVAKSSTPSDPTTRDSSAKSKPLNSYLSYWN